MLNREKYDKNKVNLPEDFTEVVIDGGCHAYFGMYGAQAGDGTPAITNKEQIDRTADAISELIESADGRFRRLRRSGGIFFDILQASSPDFS